MVESCFFSPGFRHFFPCAIFCISKKDYNSSVGVYTCWERKRGSSQHKERGTKIKKRGEKLVSCASRAPVSSYRQKIRINTHPHSHFRTGPPTAAPPPTGGSGRPTTEFARS